MLPLESPRWQRDLGCIQRAGATLLCLTMTLPGTSTPAKGQATHPLQGPREALEGMAQLLQRDLEQGIEDGFHRLRLRGGAGGGVVPATGSLAGAGHGEASAWIA